MPDSSEPAPDEKHVQFDPDPPPVFDPDPPATKESTHKPTSSHSPPLTSKHESMSTMDLGYEHVVVLKNVKAKYGR